MKRLTIEQLKEGFIFSDDDGDKYAIPATQLSIKVKAYFGLTKVEPKRERNNIAPPVVTGKDARQCPETQGNKTADSHSAGATSILETPGFDSPAAPLVLHPSDLKIAKFDYDLLAEMQKYKSLEFLELPDGKSVLDYAHSRYYTSKEAVMQIPFPFPRGYFSKKNGWSSSVEQAFKMYRRYLVEAPDGRCKAQKKSGAEINPLPQSSDSSASGVSPEDPDDWKYKKILNTNTRTDYDNNKIEGSLEV